MDEKGFKYYWKKTWHFIWEEDSLLSWVVNVVLAYVLIKFLVYPGLGLVLDTSHPIVAVVSGSMEHEGSFDDWWDSQEQWYVQHGISKEEFREYSFKNGFNKGDIMILKNIDVNDIDKGDVMVFWSNRPDPIIHRVVVINDPLSFQTKGDHNQDSIKASNLDETQIKEDRIIGIAKVKIPFLGYIKIWFVDLLRFIGIV